MEATPTDAPRAKFSLVAVFVLALVAALCAPTAAQATGTYTGSSGSITVNAGGLRSSTNTDNGYAVPLTGLSFQKAAWTSNPAAAGWSHMCTSDASGDCTSGTVANGRYLVRETPGGAPTGWRALTKAAWGGASTGASPSRDYVGDVSVSGGNVTVRPSTAWSPTAQSSSSGAFIAAKNNPPLPDRCGLDVLLLLDRSGSIASQKNTYRTAARQFVSTLSGTPTRLKISSFSDTTSADQSSFLDLDDASDVSTANAKIDGVYSSPDGSTNWDGGMNLAANAGVDVVVFITDGNPTYRNTPTGTSSGGFVDLLDLTAGVASANKVKTIGKSSGAGATILAVGAGSGVTAQNLADVSGPVEGQDYVTSSVAGLDEKLQEIANKLCGARIHVRKLTNESTSARAGWTFTAGKPSGSPATFDPSSVTTAGSPAPEGFIAVDDLPAAGSAITLTETRQAGYGFVASKCQEGSFPSVTSGGAVTATIATMHRNEDWYCTFRNRVLEGSIAIEKTGTATAYHGDTLTYQFTATNDGETPLTNVTVADNRCAPLSVTSKRNGAGQLDTTPTVLDLTDTWIYECSMPAPSHVTGELNPIVNTVTATGRDTQDNTVSDTDQHTTQLLHPAINVEKAGTASAFHGDNLMFEFTVTNAGDTPLTNVTVSDNRCTPLSVTSKRNAAGQADTTPNALDLTDTWSYECSMPAPVHQTGEANPIVNTVTATGRYTGDRTVSDTDQHSTLLLHAAINVEKAGFAWAYHGDDLTFDFTVTNAGDTPLPNVTVSDDHCAPLSVRSKRNGAGQADTTPSVLDRTDTWIYECSMPAPVHQTGEANPLVNTVTATSRYSGDRTVSDTANHATLLLHPAIAIDKTGPATAQAGDKILYTLDVTNPGDLSFDAPNVNVTDALCEAPPMLITKNGDASPGRLNPGDRWTYTCSVQTLAGQTRVDNIGVVTGKDSYGGRVVTARDPATTLLNPPPPPPPPPSDPPITASGGPITPVAQVLSTGTARLTGPSRCVSGPFAARVTGNGIAKVVFMLDGKRFKTVLATGARTMFKAQIRPRGRSSKAHRVTAVVTFKASANTRSRTLRFAYLGCSRRAAAPQFAG